MLHDLNTQEIKMLSDAIMEGKTYGEAIDELYPKTEIQCFYECALENSRSFSLLETIYNAITKRPQPKMIPCNCLASADSTAHLVVS